jgi:hypothetical protein
MVSPQEAHTSVRVLSSTGCGCVAGVEYGICDSPVTGGSTTELSATDAWHEAVVGDVMYVRLIRTIAT